MASNLFDSRTRCEANWDEHRGNKSFVLMRNAGHYTATDACYLLPPSMQSLPATGCGGNMIDSSVANRIFAGYLTAFFSLTLKGDERYRDYLKGFISSGLLVPATAYLRAQRIRGEIISDVVRLLEGYDCLICPSTVDTAPEGLQWTGSPAFNSPWSLTGLPTVTVPSGLSGEGLPLGLQLVGRPYDDIGLFRVAAWCEKTLEFPTGPKDPHTP